jgi:hypothetical protein
MTTWPSREQWAIEHRTFYNDDDIRVSAKAADYASPEEIAAAIAEAKALWTEMGRQVKAAGPPITQAEWNRRYRACQSREERDQHCDSPEYLRLRLSYERSRLNRDIIKKLVAGFVPDSGFRTNGATASSLFAAVRTIPTSCPKPPRFIAATGLFGRPPSKSRRPNMPLAPSTMPPGKLSSNAAPASKHGSTATASPCSDD